MFCLLREKQYVSDFLINLLSINQILSAIQRLSVNEIQYSPHPTLLVDTASLDRPNSTIY
jgi:hypothetical protein